MTDGPTLAGEETAPSHPWSVAQAATLTELLSVQPGPSSSLACEWRLAKLGVGDAGQLEAAAWKLADHIMQLRSGESPAYPTWRAKAIAGPAAAALSARDRKMVDAFIRPAFGLPDNQKSADHVQGYIAEALWHLLASEEAVPDRSLRVIESPSWMSTEPGSDGLVVYEIDGGVLIFRLWEIKKATGKAHLSKTIARACDQISLRGLEYIAKCTSFGSRNTEEAIAGLFAELPALWCDDDPRGGLGIAVATSVDKAPIRKCFGGVRSKFPVKSAGGRLEGLIAAIGDYTLFAERVRDFVWSGR